MANEPKSVGLFRAWQLVFMVILAGASFALLGPVLAFAVLGWAAFFVLIADHNWHIRRDGTLMLAVQDYVLRVRDFLFDNPWVSANDTIRRQLLPTAEETQTMSFHHSLVEEFDEFREGTSWLMKGGLRAGVTPNMKLIPESDVIRNLHKQIRELREANIALQADRLPKARLVAEPRDPYDAS